MHRCNLFLLIVLVLSLLLNVCFADDTDRYKQVVSEWQSQWKSYLHKTGNLSFRRITKEYENSKLVIDTSYDYDCMFPNIKTNRTGGNSVRAFNQYYFFETRGDAKTGFHIENIGMIDSLPNLDEWDFIPASVNLSFVAGDGPNRIANVTTGGLRLFPVWLPSLMKEKGFCVTSIENRKEADDKITVLRFTFHADDKKMYMMCPTEGELILLSDHYHLIKRGTCSGYSDTELSEMLTATTQNEYDYTTFDFPVLTSAITNITEKGRIFRQEFTYSKYGQLSGVAPTRFMLSHYGFSEPEFKINKPMNLNPLRFILITLGTVLIVLALVMMYRKRKRKNQSTTDES